ncbi:hypothetical protein Fmac_030295 [Flemingia macrophylla]|uniref:Uncharacterized protein n=1 Tax=Flemingia macrophylla TaxID=520843 RepID=A0ABD1LCS3_9FABA
MKTKRVTRQVFSFSKLLQVNLNSSSADFSLLILTMIKSVEAQSQKIRVKNYNVLYYLNGIDSNGYQVSTSTNSKNKS